MLITTRAPFSKTSAAELATAEAPIVIDASSLLVKLSAQPNFSLIERMPRGAARKRAAYEALTATAKTSQVSAIELAEKLKNDGAISGYEALVSPNMLVVRPQKAANKADIAAAFQALQGVRAIYDNANGARYKSDGTAPVVPMGPWGGLDVIGPAQEIKTEAPSRPYGIDLIAAPQAWELKADGSGLVYGSIDTGVDISHTAIANNYRGKQLDGALSHDYNWYDPTGRSTVAKDFDQHGTHTIGTVLGEGVGVAPKAKFISAAGIYGQPGGLLKSLQWMLAPTKVDGSAPDPSKGADVVGMSWWTGPNNEDLFLESMRNLRAAGIEPVKSAGNNGPRTGSISSPGQFPELIATAAVDSQGKVANFSSRGPAPYPEGSTTPKPDFAAPGVMVTSTLPGNRYGSMSGTSMAQPHMSGAILDILSAYPQLTHNQLYAALKAGATDSGAPGFDPEYGNGTINIAKSLEAAKLAMAQH